ncbi:hypothetical protein BX285_4672 [Streptomyces sp. 1114.5]|uniref:hypothetical protein n=1 Tax=Streptomyces sp. 1114.5 TaxID=1938830 RepID=UPI000EB179DC|nr:hypothetical protein [Streptomyces sp. 1114.5]RKT20190.1 hypothetical protein BX285_4672 [Streptomyces sp. 1114.5]
MTDHATPPPPASDPLPPQPPTAPATPPAPEPAIGAVEFTDFAPTPEELAQQQARRARRRKAAVRWSCAALVFALAGTGTALAVTAPERTDIPGLATAGDGRYTFPPLTLPPLPSGKAAPDGKGKALHYADLRYLLLPAPKEAGGTMTAPSFPAPTPKATASGSPTASPTGSPATSPAASAAPHPGAAPAPALADWVPCDAILAEQQDPAKLRELLLEDACRAATVREWTASDGTRTQIRLLRFGSAAESWDAFSSLRSKGRTKAAPDTRTTAHKDWDTVDGVDLTALESTANGPKGNPTARVAYLCAADILAVITMTNPDGVPTPPFRQVATLQSDLLAGPPARPTV